MKNSDMDESYFSSSELKQAKAKGSTILELRKKYFEDCSSEINNYLKNLFDKRNDGDPESISKYHHYVCSRKPTEKEDINTLENNCLELTQKLNNSEKYQGIEFICAPSMIGTSCSILIKRYRLKICLLFFIKYSKIRLIVI